MKKQQQTFPRFILFMVKLGFRNQSVPQKIIKARKVIGMMTDNANFPTPSPSLAVLTACTDALEEAEAAMDGSKLKTVERNTKLKTFSAKLQATQFYVEGVALGNVQIILSSGFDVRNLNNKPVDLTAPINFTAKNGLPNLMDLKWKPVKGAKLYKIEMTTDINLQDWKRVSQSTKAKATITGLEGGQLYFFRVTAVNAKGQSPYSDIARGRPNFG